MEWRMDITMDRRMCGWIRMMTGVGIRERKGKNMNSDMKRNMRQGLMTDLLTVTLIQKMRNSVFNNNCTKTRILL